MRPLEGSFSRTFYTLKIVEAEFYEKSVALHLCAHAFLRNLRNLSFSRLAFKNPAALACCSTEQSVRRAGFINLAPFILTEKGPGSSLVILRARYR